MKSSAALFDLIHSLTAHEKGYFKRFVSHADGKSKIYVQLFDAINTQSKYDEEKLKKKFAKTASNFSAAKSYLYESILSSLRESHFRDDRYAQVLEHLATADILSGRRLFAEALEYLEKAAALSEEIAEPALRILAFDRTLLIASHTNDKVELARLMNGELDKAIDCANEIKADISVRRAVTWLNHFRILYSGPVSAAEHEDFLKRATEYVIQLESMALAPHHRLAYYQLKYIISEQTGNYEEGLRFINEMLSVFILPELNQIGFEGNHVVALWNAANYCLVHYPQKAKSFIDQLDHYVHLEPKNHNRTPIDIAKRLRYLLLLRLYNRNGDQKSANQLLIEIKEWLSRKPQLTPRVQASLSFEIALTHFISKNYRQALLHLNDVYSNTGSERNILLSSLLLEMIIQYESGEAEYILRLIKPLQKQLLAYKLTGTFYHAAYECFTRIIRNPEPRHVQKLLLELLQQIESIATDMSSRNPELIKLVLPWLRSQKARVSFAEALQSGLGTNSLRSKR